MAETRKSTRQKTRVIRFAQGYDNSSDLSELSSTEDHDSDAPSTRKKTLGPKRTLKAKTNKDVFGQAEYKINTDNTLFENVRASNSALELVADEWVASYTAEHGSGPALAQLVNFAFRASVSLTAACGSALIIRGKQCCGCNASVDQDEVLDLDAAISKLDDIQDAFQKSAQRAYPLVATRSKNLKAFRKNLAELLRRLVQHAHASEILYDDTFCETFQTWLAAATSSRLRSFRHTTTVIVLDFITALCRVAVQVATDFASATRQRDLERDHNKKRADKARLNNLERNVSDLHSKKVKLQEYLNELFDGVFVHRYRDAEPAIRCECVKALGEWMKTYPDHYVDGNHLRYLGWNLTDMSKDARLEAVTALKVLYSKPEHIGSLQHFTERFKGRLVEMACSEPDLTVRKVSLQVLQLIDRHGLLEDEQRTELAKLIFHVDPRVRRAVSPFYLSIVHDALEEKISDGVIAVTDKANSLAKKRLFFKTLAGLLNLHGQSLMESDPDQTFSYEEEEAATAIEDVMSNLKQSQKPRAGLAFEALWQACYADANVDDEDGAISKTDGTLQEWQVLAEYLLCDHGLDRSESHVDFDDSLPDTHIDDALKLNEEEESLLLDVLSAAVSCAAQAAEKLGESGEHDRSEITRTLMKLLPRLLTQYQIDHTKVATILHMIPVIQLGMYLDLRMTTAYEGLWQQVTKQYLQQTSTDCLAACRCAIDHFLSNSTLRDINDAKFASLTDGLINHIRDAVTGQDVASAAFSDEQELVLTAWMARLALLYGSQDLGKQINDTGDKAYTSVFAIASAIADRGLLGRESEEKMVIYALDALFLHLAWTVKVVINAADSPNEAQIKTCVSVRDRLLQNLEELAVGTSSSATQPVRQNAFKQMMLLYVMLYNVGRMPPDGKSRNDLLASLQSTCTEELQYRCAGFVQAEIQQFAEKYSPVTEMDTENDAAMQESDTGIDDEAVKRSKARKEAVPTSDFDIPQKNDTSKPATDLQAEFTLMETLYGFIRGIISGVLNIRHASVILGHYGRFGPLYDECCKQLCDQVKEAGLYGDEADDHASVVVDSLKESYDAYMMDGRGDDSSFTSLARLLAGSIVSRGSKLTVQKLLPSAPTIHMHQELIDYTLDKIVLAQQASGKRKNQLSRSMAMFKILNRLALPLQSRDALKIQTHLDASLQSRDLVVSSSKTWDALRAYTKKLASIMAKDSGITRAAKRMRLDAPSDDEAGETQKQKSKRTATGQRAKAAPTVQPTRIQPRRGAVAPIQTYAEDNEGDGPDMANDIASSTLPVSEREEEAESEPDANQSPSLGKRVRSPSIDPELDDQRADSPGAQSQASMSDFKRRKRR